MNLVRRAAQQFGAGMSLADMDRVLDSMYGGTPSYTGKLVSEVGALAVSAVWSCVNVLASDIATTPFTTYRRIVQDGVMSPTAKEPAPDHYLWTLLQEEANPEMTAWRFKQLMMAWMLLWGNAYAEIEISGRGQVTALWPWRPDRTKVDRDDNGQLVYTYTMKDGKKFSLPHTRMFHLRGLSVDGVLGLSPIQVHKQTVGLSMAVTEHGARFFGTGARPLGIIEVPEAQGDKAYERLSKWWNSHHQGLENAHRIGILEEGAKWHEAGADMVDAQYIETAKLTQEDIARIYNVPPHRIGLLERSTNNNIEQQSLDYVINTLMPICENWKQQIGLDMLSARERLTIIVSSNFKYFLRGNYESLAKYITAVRQWGISNADEIREEFMDQNPQPDGLGKEYWRPVNMQDTSDPPVQPGAPGMVPNKPKPKPTKPNGAAHDMLLPQ